MKPEQKSAIVYSLCIWGAHDVITNDLSDGHKHVLTFFLQALADPKKEPL